MSTPDFLGKNTLIKTNLGVLIAAAIVIFAWGVTYTTLNIQVNTNTEQVKANSASSIDTRIRLAEIQTQLEANAVTLSEIKERLN